MTDVDVMVMHVICEVIGYVTSAQGAEIIGGM